MPRIGNVCKGKHKRRSSCSDLEDSSFEDSALILAGISQHMKPLFPCAQGTYPKCDGRDKCSHTDISFTDSCSCSDTESLGHTSRSDNSCSCTESISKSYTGKDSRYNWDTEEGSTIYIENCDSRYKRDSQESSECSSGNYSSSTYCTCTDSSSNCSYCSCTKKYSGTNSGCNCTEGFCSCPEISEISKTSGSGSAVWCSTTAGCSDTSECVTTVSEMSGNERCRPTQIMIRGGKHVYDRNNLPHTIFVAEAPQNASSQIILEGQFPISTSVVVKSTGKTRVMVFPKGNKIESFDRCGNIVVGASPYNISGIRGSVTLSFMPESVWGITNLFRGVITYAG